MIASLSKFAFVIVINKEFIRYLSVAFNNWSELETFSTENYIKPTPFEV